MYQYFLTIYAWISRVSSYLPVFRSNILRPSNLPLTVCPSPFIPLHMNSLITYSEYESHSFSFFCKVYHFPVTSSHSPLSASCFYPFQICFSLTLRLLMSYIYGAPSKARNANVVYIWTYVWQR